MISHVEANGKSRNVSCCNSTNHFLAFFMTQMTDSWSCSGERATPGMSTSLPGHQKRRTLRTTSPAPRWFNIPTHLLSPTTGPAQHARSYSSDSKNPFKEGLSQEPASPTSRGFGFQSLTSLFHLPQSGRYSRARVAETEPGVSNGAARENTSVESIDKPATTPIESTERKSNDGFFKSMWSTPSEAPALEHRGSLMEPHFSPSESQQLDPSTGRATHGRLRVIRRLEGRVRPLKHGSFSLKRGRVPNPFALSSKVESGPSDIPPNTPNHGQWSLSASDRDTIESFSDPSVSMPAPKSIVTDSTLRPDSKPALTHVTPSGTARMVDVGSKAATKRTAIAHAFVRFSNPDPFRLISTNSNQKGDVLSVARIAGIMAAKRTADIIPLCHPIAISQVIVEITAVPPGTVGGWFWDRNAHGIVSITSRVDCIGPTGVEMEALTSASAAALTVIDMCKAVDRGTGISSTKLMYKSGGRSGIYVRDRGFPLSYYEDQGLEVPPHTKANEPEPPRSSFIKGATRR